MPDHVSIFLKWRSLHLCTSIFTLRADLLGWEQNCELTVTTTWWAHRVIPQIAHSKVTVWVANSWKAHSKLTLWAYLVGSLWGRCRVIPYQITQFSWNFPGHRLGLSWKNSQVVIHLIEVHMPNFSSISQIVLKLQPCKVLVDFWHFSKLVSQASFKCP